MDAEPKATCAVEIDYPCHLPAIKGHIIPKSRLKIISRNQRVIVAEAPPANDVQQIGWRTDKITFRPLSSRRTTTDEFSCNTHDIEPFQDVEQKEVDWRLDDGDIMRKLALLAYKATLPAYVRQDRSARIWERLTKAIDHDNPELLPGSAINMAKWERTQANRTGAVKSFLERMLRNQDFGHMTHIVTQAGSSPLLAACAFFTLGRRLVDEPWGAIGHVPEFITAYPSSYGQTLIRSWITPEHPDLTILGLGPSDTRLRHQEAQAASILLLQQSDVIAISPAVWENYGPTKQRAIREHFEKTMPYSASPMQAVEELPNPQLLNLFNTTGLII